jgi:predicted nucleotide-binding protein
MPKTTLFVGSSTAAKSQAKAVVEHFKGPTIEFLPWWDDAFTAGKTLLEELDNIRAKVDGAILLFSPEAEATVRKQTVWTPNLNVLFEFGYFYGHFGKEKVAMLKYGDFYLPSDFGGYIHIFGSTFFRRGAVVKVGQRTAKEFGSWVAKLPAT